MKQLCLLTLLAIQVSIITGAKVGQAQSAKVLGRETLRHFELPRRYQDSKLNLAVSLSFFDDSTIVLACDNILRVPNESQTVSTMIGKDYLAFKTNSRPTLSWFIDGVVDQTKLSPVSSADGRLVAYIPFFGGVQTKSGFCVVDQTENLNRCLDAPDSVNVTGVYASPDGNCVWICANQIPAEVRIRIREEGWFPQPYSGLTYFVLQEPKSEFRLAHDEPRALTEFVPYSSSVWSADGQAVYSYLDATDYQNEPFDFQALLASYDLRSAKWVEHFRGRLTGLLPEDSVYLRLEESVFADDSSVVFAATSTSRGSGQGQRGYLLFNFRNLQLSWLSQFASPYPVATWISPNRDFVATLQDSILKVLSAKTMTEMFRDTVCTLPFASFDFDQTSKRFCYVKRYGPGGWVDVVWGELNLTN